MTDGADHEFMARALELAGRAAASSDPNPAVGCVVVRDGRIVGEGFTQRAGGNHAEIEALKAAGEAAVGATVYVSLEPCSHTGRTGPCAEALIKAAVARVVYALEDPNPAVAGKGAAMLAAVGIATEAQVLAAAAREINRGYCARFERGRPWVRCKMAASLDGRTALANGASQWITGASARRDVHRWRARASAILTGVGTVIADDPALSARPDDDFGIDVLQPVRVIVDSDLRTPPGARTLRLDGQVVIFTGNTAREASGDRAAALEQAGAKIETVTADPRCRLDEVLARLNALEVNDVWLEAGPTLAGAMLSAGLIDELVLYFAPSLLGTESHGMFSLPTMTDLDEQIRLEIDDLRKVDEDLRIVARPVSG